MSNSRFLQTGDVIALKHGHTVYVEMPTKFLYGNKFKFGEGWEIGRGVLRIGDTIQKGPFSFQTDWLADQFVVVSTEISGGGKNYDGNFGDGHLVKAQKLNDPTCRVSFYQSGSFTAIIPPNDLDIVGKAESVFRMTET